MERTTSQNALLLTSNFSGEGQRSGSDETPRLTTGFVHRNFIVGILGILFNSLAFLVVFKSKKLKEGKKLLLLNLVESDILMMIVLCVYSAVDSAQISEGGGCVPVVNLIFIALATSNFFAFLVSAANYLAVGMPFRYRLLRMKHWALAVACVWSSAVGLCIGLVGLKPFPPGRTCSPIVVIHGGRMAILSTVFLVSFIGTMVFNLAVVVRLRKGFVSFRTGDLNPGTSNQGQKRKEVTLGLPQQEAGLKLFPNPFRPHQSRVGLATPDTMRAPFSQVGAAVTVKNAFELRKTAGPCPCTSTEHPVRFCESTPPTRMHVSFIHTEPEPDESKTPASSSSQEQTRSDRDKHVIVMPRIASSPNHEICKTLLILTTYCTLITLPFILYMFRIAATVEVDPDNMVGTPLGIFMSSLPPMNACINPFFYVIKFVNWRGIVNKLRGKGSPGTVRPTTRAFTFTGH